MTKISVPSKFWSGSSMLKSFQSKDSHHNSPFCAINEMFKSACKEPQRCKNFYNNKPVVHSDSERERKTFIKKQEGLNKESIQDLRHKTI